MNKYFRNNQHLLLKLVNTEAGKHLIGKLGQKIEYPIIQITQNSFIEFVGFEGKKSLLRGTFFPRQPIYKLLAPVLLQMEIARESKYKNRILNNPYEAFLHYSNLQFSKRLPFIFLNSSTFNPVAGANFPVDGNLFRAGVNETLSTIINGAGTGADTTALSNTLGRLEGSTTSNQYGQLGRALSCFDTSSLTASASISSAILSYFGTTTYATGLGIPTLHLCAATPASDSNLIASDFNVANFGSTSFANIAGGSWNQAGYNDFTLNASGISNINKTGGSQFGSRLDWDLNNSTTGLTWASGADSYMAGNFADNGSNIPKLVVTFTLTAKGVKGSLLLMGLGN